MRWSVDEFTPHREEEIPLDLSLTQRLNEVNTNFLHFRWHVGIRKPVDRWRATSLSM